jgi:outer membrane receptor protein involved in Fe transport
MFLSNANRFALCIAFLSAGIVWADDGSSSVTDGESQRHTVSISDDEVVEEQGVEAEEASFFQPAPNLPPVPPIISDDVLAPGSGLLSSGFPIGTVNRSLLSETRRANAFSPATDIVLGSEGKFRVTTDGGNLLGKSLTTRGVSIQTRTPIVTDPRIRGDRIGRLLASGSYWLPARQDLDTALSKIDSRIIENIIVIKGPYSSRYGPGFNFVDFQLLESPRYECGFGWNGSTSLEYKTNGAQWYGRETVWGGSDNYGFRVGYGHRTGSDYRTGNGSNLISSYNSRDVDFAFGYDPTCDSRIEFNYLRLDQTDVEFPGLVFDIDFLVTDGYEVQYVVENQSLFDRFEIEGWYNRTRFEGDTLRSGKNLQIPALEDLLVPFGGTGFAATDVDSMSTGSRFAFSWGDECCSILTLGADVLVVNQNLNDIEGPGTATPVNRPIPEAKSADVGVFFDEYIPVNDSLKVSIGGRVDFVDTTSANTYANFFDYTGLGFTNVEQLKDAGLDQSFTLWGLFTTAEYAWNESITLTGGAGYAERPPTLTELYTNGSFIGSLQPGLTFLEGDPELDPERRLQVDLGVHADYGSSHLSLNGYYAWVRDMIIFDDVFGGDLAFGAPFPGQGRFHQVAYGNTDLATLAGVELAGQQDLNCWLTAFGNLSYVEGRDHTRNEASRLGDFRREFFGIPIARSGDAGFGAGFSDDEPLPGIVPLEARVGVRLHDPCETWGVELEARIVDNQDRVATSLFERATSGFTIWNLRSFWQPRHNLTLISGVENFTDKFYREHLDYRSGRGVFQPGVNFYSSVELTY